MCGITGIYNFGNNSNVDLRDIDAMTDIIEHRGPDDRGTLVDSSLNFAFGHRRLSIIDLAGGHQPMSDESSKVWLVYNGEIYNFLDIREKLIKRGVKFRTNSDTEVIIYAYLEYGSKFIHELNGIFAFAIFDKRNNSILLARDHFGVKPLYFYLDKSRGLLLFGSEIKSILASSGFKRELDKIAISNYLTFRYNPSPETLIKGIRKLAPGHIITVNYEGKESISQYCYSNPITNRNIKLHEAVEKYQSLLENSVKSQMISDVPVGLLLSGGLDSAVIGKLMAGYSSTKIKTFSIGFEGKGDYNELSDAKKTSELIGSEHYEMIINDVDYLEFFYKSFYFTEEPIAEPTIPALYYVSKLTSENVKVVLAGQGADEPLAGYKRYLGEVLITKFAKYFRGLKLNEIAKFLPRNQRLKRGLYSLNYTDDFERILAINTIYTNEQKKNLFKDTELLANVDKDILILKYLFEQTGQLDNSLSKLLFVDTRSYLSDSLLIFGDKMSMANSIEMRVPFLDVNLIQFLESLPPEFKIHFTNQKYIHKLASKKWLPKEIIYRKKRGFATPIDKWFQGNFINQVKEILLNNNSLTKELFNESGINNILDSHRLKKQDFHKHIFALLSLELWYSNFFSKNFKGK